MKDQIKTKECFVHFFEYGIILSKKLDLNKHFLMSYYLKL